MQTREEKIQFLKDIQTGKVKIENALPKVLSVVFKTVFEIDSYMIDGKKVTDEEYYNEKDLQRKKYGTSRPPFKSNIQDIEAKNDDEQHLKDVWLKLSEQD